MFEYNGEDFTYEDVLKAAEAKSMSFDDYITKYNINKKADTEGKPTSQGQGAPVAETAAPEIQLTDTVSPSADGSLDLEEISLEEKKKLPYEVRQQLNREQNFSRKRVNELTTNQLVRKEDVLDYEEAYSDFQKNRNTELRATVLKNNGVDIAAPAINENLLKAKAKEILGNKKITSRSLPEKEYQDIFKNIFESDKYLSRDLPLDILKTYSKEIKAKQQLIEKKYDLTSQEGVDQANNEFSNFQDSLIKAGLKTNKTYNDRLKSYSNALGLVLEESKIEYDRGILNEELIFGLNENTPAFVEGLQKGFKQIGLSLKKSWNAAEGESLQQDITEKNRINNLDNQESVTYGGRFIPNVGWSGAKTGNKEEALAFYNEKITNKKALLLNSIKENIDEEELQRAFKSANLDDGITFSDVSLLVGEQALQLPLAYFTSGVGVFAQEFGNSYFDNIDAYLDKNNIENTPENMLKAVEAGEGDVAIAATVGVINAALEKVGADNIAKGVFGKTGKTALTSLVNDGFKKYIKSQAAKEGATQIAKGGFVEFLTESFQTTASQLGKGKSVDDIFGYIDTKEISNSAKAGGIVGTILPLGGTVVRSTAKETKQAAKIVAAKFDTEATLNYLNTAVEEIQKSETLTEKEKSEQLESIADVKNANVKIPTFIKGDAKKQALDLIIEKNSLEKIISEADPNLVVEEKARVETINKKIQEVAIKSKITELGEADIDKAKRIAEKLPELKTVVKDFNTTAELEEALIASGRKKGEAKKLSNDFGFIIQKEDGSQEIYINKEISFNSGVATTAQHEVLHSLLKNIIPGNIGLGKNLKDFVEEVAGSEFMNTEFSKRFEDYENQYNNKISKLNDQVEKKEISEEEFSKKKKAAEENMWEETMPLLSESLTRGDIDSKSTIFEKLKDFFNKVFNTSNIKNVEFNNGKDVFNFIKDYNKIYKSGKGIETLKGVAQGKAEGKLISNEKSQSEETTKPSLSRELASEKVQKLYGIYSNPQTSEKIKSKVEGDIASEFMGSVNNIVNRYRDRPGFKTFEEDLKVDVVTQAGGLLTLIRKYDPSKNDSLAAFVNTYLKVRAIPIINKTLGIDEASTFKSDVTEVKDVTATETSEDAVNASEEIAKEKPKKEKAKISDKVKFDEALNTEVNDQLVKGISLGIDKYTAELTANKTISPFIADLKMHLANSLEKSTAKFIKNNSVEEFLVNNRELLLDNLTTTFLSKHPFFRKGILKRVKGEWVAPTRISEYKYDWVDSKGNKLKVDRDNAAGRGLTSGPEFIKRNPKIKEVLKENEFVDYHFQDGANRTKIKLNPISSVSRQIISEYGLEVLQKDLLQNGPLSQRLSEVADLKGIVLAESGAIDIANSVERGLIKLSISPKKLNRLVEDASSFMVDFAGKSKDDLETFKSVLPKYLQNESKEDFDFIAEYIYEGFNKFMKPLLNKDIPPKEAFKIIQSDFFNNLNARASTVSIVGGKNTKLINNKGKLTENGEALNDFFVKSWTAKLLSKSTPELQLEELVNLLVSSSRTIRNDAFLKTNSNIEKTLLNKIFKNKKLSHLKNKITLQKNNSLTYLTDKTDKDGNKITDAKGNVIKVKTRIGIPTEYNISEKSRQYKIAESYVDGYNGFSNMASDMLYDQYVEIKKTGDINLFKAWASIQSQSRSLLRLAANLAEVDSKLDTVNKKTVWEHKTPASEIMRIFAANFISENLVSDQQLIKELNEYVVALVNEDIDNTLTDNGRKEITGRENISQSPDTRYDVLSKEQKARLVKVRKDVVKESLSNKAIKSMNTTFNEMVERKKGFISTETISKTRATLAGARKGRYDIIVPPSAEDLEGLLYNFMGSKQQGNADKKFFDEKIFRPLARANFNLNKERQGVKTNFGNLVKANKGILKLLSQESDYKYYNNDSAVRVWLWNKLGYEIPGIELKDETALLKAVNTNPKLLKFAEALVTVPNKKESWLKPEDGWTASTIEMDLQEILSKIGRARIFGEYIQNADIIFSENNLNKIQAAYGQPLRNALEDMLYRIEKGRARQIGDNKLANTYLNWVRGSVAVTMFFHMKSALLQQLSIVNFTNWEENNILAQGKFLAQPKLYAKYWVKIFNSDWMKERRQGLKTDINEAELATILERSKNPNKKLLSYILEKGFSLTKYGDNFAIATGGAAYLYHREQMYIKQGLTEAKAKEEAFLDFQEIAEKTQQSSRQDLLSNQQVSVVGRLFLAFQNTTMQMTRLTKKAALDLINRRGSAKANIARIVYYGTIQNMIFSFLQNALFAVAGIDDEEESEKLLNKKGERMINNVIDGFLRGTGIGGSVIAAVKNAMIAWKKESDKGWGANDTKVLLELLNVSPPVGIKARNISNAMTNYKYNKKILGEIGYDNPNNPYYGIAGSLSSAAFNIPLDRVVRKMSNLKAATQQDAEAWQRAALFLGWSSWDLGMEEDPEIKKAKENKKGFKSGFKNQFKDEFKNEFK